MMGGRRVVSGLAVGLGLSLFASRSADAFCGFYVSGADAKMFNDATQVVLMRDGTRTVLSMQNDYKGPPADFALVVPVPVVLQKENVKTLSKDVFDRIDKLTAPRLVEYWEQDPCAVGLGGLGTIGHGAGTGTGQGFGSGHGRAGGGDYGVTIAAEFSVGEYDILILGAKDSTGLDAWLRDNHYKIPAGAADVLKPYVESGSKFFVAKVDISKVKFDSGGRAALSPLRFHYDSEKLELPVKLGLLNSSGTQDLIVYVLGRERYEVANFTNVTIPTNLDVSEKARGEFGAFYSSLYDHTVEQNPGAVVTEYAWQATSCDPCPGDTTGMTGADIASLGADVVPTLTGSGGVRSSPPTVRMGATEVSPGLAPEVVHRIVRQSFGRYRLCYENGLRLNPTLNGRVVVKFDIAPDGSVASAKDGGSDLPDKTVVDCVVRAFQGLTFPQPDGKKKVTVTYPITFAPGGGGVGGSGGLSLAAPLVVTRLHARYGQGSLGQDLVFRVAHPIVGGRELWSEDNKLDHGAAKASTTSSFQARYAIRHPWTGPIECKEPHRGTWGGPWPDAGAKQETTSATKLGLQPHGTTTLSAFTTAANADLGGTPLGAKDTDAGPSTATNAANQDAGRVEAEPKPSSKCGCRAVGEASTDNPFGLLLLGMLAAARRRSRPDDPSST
ncbi:MAG: DUF2330 domain-containing protein [Labilithrix sp.]